MSLPPLTLHAARHRLFLVWTFRQPDMAPEWHCPYCGVTAGRGLGRAIEPTVLLESQHHHAACPALPKPDTSQGT